MKIKPDRWESLLDQLAARHKVPKQVQLYELHLIKDLCNVILLLQYARLRTGIAA